MAQQDNILRGRIITEEKKLACSLPGTLILHAEPNVEHYTGNYEVVPSPESVVLPTEKKYLNSDVTVHAIPFFSVGNNAGGNTVYIGSEKEITMT